jgi:hypothetical protein
MLSDDSFEVWTDEQEGPMVLARGAITFEVLVRSPKSAISAKSDLSAFTLQACVRERTASRIPLFAGRANVANVLGRVRQAA